MSLPLLTLIVLLPLLSALVVFLLPARLARGVALLAMAVVLLLTTWLLFSFDPGGPRFQFAERQPWLPGLGIHWSLAVDGLSVLFLPATALL